MCRGLDRDSCICDVRLQKLQAGSCDPGPEHQQPRSHELLPCRPLSCSSDEYYLPTLLSLSGLERQTTCHGSVVQARTWWLGKAFAAVLLHPACASAIRCTCRSTLRLAPCVSAVASPQ